MIVPCSTTKSLDSFTVWRKGKRPLLQDDDITVTTNGSLVIERSKVDHSGEYDCVAVSEGGVLRATISIDIQSRPGYIALFSLLLFPMFSKVYHNGKLKPCLHGHFKQVFHLRVQWNLQ